MSIGNTIDNGNKGNNFPYQRAVTKLLSEIANKPSPTPCCPTAATEITLLAVLAALQNGQEFEQNIVIDLGGVGTPTYLQIRIFDSVTHTFAAPIYYTASGVVVVPVGPLELVNPQLVLNNILTQVTAINADLDVSLSTRASEVTLLTRATETTLSTRASEATLLSLNNKFTGVTRTPSYIQAVAVGTVAAGARTVSVYNSGTTSGVWLGTPIQPGVQLSFNAGGEDDTLAAFSYTASATATLEIITVV